MVLDVYVNWQAFGEKREWACQRQFGRFDSWKQQSLSRRLHNSCRYEAFRIKKLSCLLFGAVLVVRFHPFFVLGLTHITSENLCCDFNQAILCCLLLIFLSFIYFCLCPDLPGWIGSLLPKDASPDVVADSPWQIFGCQNGKESFLYDQAFAQLLHSFRPMSFRMGSLCMLIILCPCLTFVCSGLRLFRETTDHHGLKNMVRPLGFFYFFIVETLGTRL